MPVAETSTTEMPTVLVVDDDPLVSLVVRRALEGQPHRLHSAHDGRNGLKDAVDKSPDVVVLDNVLPDGLGIEFLSQLHTLAPTVPILFVTGRGSGSTAIEAMKQCAFDYLPKPLDPQRLRRQLDRAFALRRLTKHAIVSPAQSPAVDDAPLSRTALVGECPAMQSVFKAIGKVALQEVPVLICGEPGTGKESIAREIHGNSHHASGPFLKLHCAGLDEARLEDELFGSVLSADDQQRECRLAQARGGTLLLQEIGSMSLRTQAKLLDAIRDGVYFPRGSGTAKQVACRLIACATHPLDRLVQAGTFRSDLYYALASFVITLPPLRQRHGDLPLLIQRTVEKLRLIAAGFNVARPRVSDQALEVLCRHTWPGNIDELESVLKRALVEQKGHILLATDLHDALQTSPIVADVQSVVPVCTDWATFCQQRIEHGTDALHADAVAETERRVFTLTLAHTNGNQAQAARLLGITRASLRKKLRLYRMATHGTDS